MPRSARLVFLRSGMSRAMARGAGSAGSGSCQLELRGRGAVGPGDVAQLLGKGTTDVANWVVVRRTVTAMGV